MHQIIEAIEADVQSRPSAMEFEMAYQARVAIDRIKFAIKHAELLDALDRLEALDRRFQVRSRTAPPPQNGRPEEARG
jgi:hypothetical protein